MMGAVVISQDGLKLYVETNQLIAQCDYSSAFNLSKLTVHSSRWVWGQRSQSWGWLTLCRWYRTYMKEGAHVSCQDKKYHKQQLQTVLLKIPPAAAADQSAVFLLTFTVFTHQTQPDTNIQTSACRFRNLHLLLPSVQVQLWWNDLQPENQRHASVIEQKETQLKSDT